MLQSTQLVLYLLLGVGLSAVAGQDTACQPDVRCTDRGARCLSLIRQKAQDISGFSTVCLPEPSDIDGCWAKTRFPNQPNSLSMLVFGTPPTVDPLSGIDRYLSVHYTSPPGEYSGCDYKFETQDVVNLELDPLSDATVDAWVIRQMPQFSWPAERDELFTLIFLNFDRNVIHMGLANIRGNDVANALVVRPYDGANLRWRDPLIYSYLLYKQQGPIVSDIVPLGFNLSDFVLRHRLNGPVGINWVVVDSDGDSVGRSNVHHAHQFCPLLTQKALEQNAPDLPFMTQPYNLTVHLRVRFTSDEFTYKCGPLSITHPGSDFFLDPIGNPILNVADVRAESTRTFSMEIYTQFPNNEATLAGKLYTMIIIDEDAPFLHGLHINVEGDDMSSGTEVVPYRHPLPPAVHTYFFLLYEQRTHISLAATTSVAGFTQTNCPRNRCLHGQIQAFISVNNLQLVGVTWMRADHDDYVRCMRDQ